MGQYLAVGMVTKITTDKTAALKYKISAEDISAVKGATMAIYDFQDKKDSWQWALKPSIFEAELLPFLETLYPDLYGDGGSDCAEVLAQLRELPSTQWITFLENEGFEAFQFDGYGESDYLSFPDKGYSAKIRLNYETIILALEGKISMESYGQLFGFFQDAIWNQYKAFELSKTLRIYITG
jgi:hypothetical protein